MSVSFNDYMNVRYPVPPYSNNYELTYSKHKELRELWISCHVGILRKGDSYYRFCEYQIMYPFMKDQGPEAIQFFIRFLSSQQIKRFE